MRVNARLRVRGRERNGNESESESESRIREMEKGMSEREGRRKRNAALNEIGKCRSKGKACVRKRERDRER